LTWTTLRRMWTNHLFWTGRRSVVLLGEVGVFPPALASSAHRRARRGAASSERAHPCRARTSPHPPARRRAPAPQEVQSLATSSLCRKRRYSITSQCLTSPVPIITILRFWDDIWKKSIAHRTGCFFWLFRPKTSKYKEKLKYQNCSANSSSQKILSTRKKHPVSEQKLRHMCIRASLPRVSVNVFFSKECCKLPLWTIIADWIQFAIFRQAATLRARSNLPEYWAKQAPINVHNRGKCSVYFKSSRSTCRALGQPVNVISITEINHHEELDYLNFFLGHFGER